MIEIIPSINERLFGDVEKKIRLVEPYVRWLHLDVADGTFTANTLWHDPEDLLFLRTPLYIEVHLMIADMDLRFPDWILPQVNRVIFHLEAAHDPALVIKKIKEGGKKVGLAIRSETSWQIAEPFAPYVDLIQTLAVSPGEAGQEFKSEILDKVSHLRVRHPEVIIEVDGGIDRETGRKCAEAGANILVSANYIFNAPDIKKAIEELKNL